MSKRPRIKVGDIIGFWDWAPWDENVPIYITAEIQKIEGRLYACWSSDMDYLTSIKSYVKLPIDTTKSKVI